MPISYSEDKADHGVPHGHQDYASWGKHASSLQDQGLNIYIQHHLVPSKKDSLEIQGNFSGQNQRKGT